MPIGGVRGEKALYGPIGHPQNTTALLDSIAKLKQELHQSQMEKQNMAERMNVLITLVKRSWSGDENAIVHLGNIIGLPSQTPNFGNSSQPINNTPVPEYRNHIVSLWEHLSIRLLDREYMKIQQEIQERQRAHILNRQLYMEELLNTHSAELSNTPTLHGRSSKTLDEIDKKFLRNFSNQKPRPASGKTRPLYRIKSAPTRRAKQDGASLKLNDLFVSGGSPQTPADNTNKGFSGLYHMENGQRSKNRLQYDDPQRYKQANLFDVEAVFSSPEETKKARPASAFTGMTRPGLKSRPSSATNNVFLTQKGERPLKYETTRPVSGRPSSKNKAKSCLRSSSQPHIQNRPEYTELYSKLNLREDDEDEEEQMNSREDNMQEADDMKNVQEDESSEEEEPPEDLIGKNLRIRIDVATHQPKSVGKMVSDMQTMKTMEKDFMKTAEQLQKKLGISENGMI